MPYKTLRTFFLVVVFSFLIYLSSWLVVYALGVNTLSIQSEDTVPSLFVSLAILEDKTLYLDKYYPMMQQRYPEPDDRSGTLGITPFYLRKIDNHYVSAFPIITPLLSLPVFLVPYLLKLPITWELLAILGHISGALIASAAVGFFYLLLRRNFELDEKKSLLITIIYAFGTINFALISQAMWQHGTVQLFSILALSAVLNFLKDENIKYLYLFGLYSGIAVLARPTAALMFVLLSTYLLINTKKLKPFVWVAAGLVLPITFFILYNSVYYQSIQNQGYANQLFRNWLGDFPYSFVGVWLSPSKGILIYSPVLLFALVGFWMAAKTKIPQRDLFILFFIIVILHTLIISFWKHWFGGWSFGYRMSSDVLPFLVLGLVPWLQSSIALKWAKVFTLSVVLSVLIEIYGMFFFDGIWHAAYDRGYKDTSWLWSLKNSEFAFNVRRILVKAGYLERACEQCSLK